MFIQWAQSFPTLIQSSQWGMSAFCGSGGQSQRPLYGKGMAILLALSSIRVGKSVRLGS